jgi:hypothetical protein
MGAPFALSFGLGYANSKDVASAAPEAKFS